MINWFINHIKREEYLDDEDRTITIDQMDWFVSFSNQLWKYAKDNYIPYDLEDEENCFCVQGAILQYEDIFLQFELWNGQGSVGLCRLVEDEDLIKVSNFITMDNLEKNIPHEKYNNYRILHFVNKFKYLIDIRDISKDEAERIFNTILDGWDKI